MSNYGKFISGRQRDLSIGIDSYSESFTTLNVVGKSKFINEVSIASSVGIGTTLTPAFDLDVNGDVIIRERLYDNTVSSGDTSQVLVSTGDGISWVDVDSITGFNGITIQDEGIEVGTPGNITILNFQGQNIIAQAIAGGNIATITVDPFDAAGENTQIQYNDEGEFAGANIVFNKNTNVIGVGTTSVAAVNRTLEVYGDAEVYSDLYVNRSFVSLDNLTPQSPEELASKAYVDNFAVAGLAVQKAVGAASTVNINAFYDNGASGIGAKLFGTSVGRIVIDDVLVNIFDRVLIQNQNNLFENGYYDVTRIGSGSTSFELVRATDFDEPEEIVAGAFSFVLDGTINGGGGFVLISKEVNVIGVDDIEFTQFSSPAEIIAGDGLIKTGNVIDVVTANSNRIVVSADSIDLATVITTRSNLTTGVSTFISGLNIDGFGRVTGVITSNVVSTATSLTNGVASFAGTQFNVSTQGLVSLASTTTGAVLDAVGVPNQINIGRNGGYLSVGFAENISVVGSVTAQSFSGDGSNLTGISGGVGIRTTGGFVGTGFTTLDFRGAGVSTIIPDPGNPTTVIITIEGGRDIDTIGSANQVLFKDANNKAAGSTNLTFNGTNLICGGTVTANSDKKLKKNIKQIDNALEKTLSLRGVEFDFVNRNESSIGFIAQEVEKVVPQLVFGGDSDNEMKSIAYQNFVALLVEAIKEQQSEILHLKQEISDIKNNLNK